MRKFEQSKLYKLHRNLQEASRIQRSRCMARCNRSVEEAELQAQDEQAKQQASRATSANWVRQFFVEIPLHKKNLS